MLKVVAPADPDYVSTCARLCDRGADLPREIEDRARAIVDDVRARGDAALLEWTARLEQRTLTAATLEVPAAEWQRAADGVAPAVQRALERAAERIRHFHVRQREQAWSFEAGGATLGLRVDPLARVGLYAPGGTARYPSSVLMTAVPAAVAGVGEVVLVTPGPSPEVLAAARIAGVDRVFQIGGAQAIGALAYGTATVPRCDKIVGPGNAYVAAAKRLVFGTCDIDSVAGPSEILVIADAAADPRHVAADLLSQAEHDTAAWPVLVTPSRALADAVAAECVRQVATLPRREIAEAALRGQGVAVVVADLAEAVRFANRFAPEHTELVVADARSWVEALRTSGAIFVGSHTPEAVGDYVAGPNHVLPTAGTARWASPLGVWDFIKRTTVIEYSAAALAEQAEDIVALATVEGLDAHGRSVTIRAGDK
ncbi:MAG: histidinol dehydrogenase [Deltaproteobacteria bacterium]|nr:histidinol dehydrogenase [Deltaproteobacteria bacterium]